MGGVPRWMDPVRTHEAIRGIAALPELVRSVLEDGMEARLQRPGKKRASRESVSMLEEEGEGEAVVGDEDVAKEEVESRDEGWGGGEEARESVQEMEVEDGTVRKKE